jgi:hypothetical protein
MCGKKSGKIRVGGRIEAVKIAPPPAKIIGRGTIIMFFFYFNKLGWLGSILVSIALTVILILAVRAFAW